MKNFFIKKTNTKRGFTLIEMMISVALFSVIMVIGIGTVLSANNAHKKTQNVRAILDNLSFVMEDMSRNLRTGSSYHCGGGTLYYPLDGSPCSSIAFESVTGDPTNTADQWEYSISCLNTTGKNTQCQIYKNSTPITPAWPAMEIDYRKSGFTVVGACPKVSTTCSDNIQPKVIIRLSGSITYQNTVTPFDLQTTVSQRMYDN